MEYYSAIKKGKRNNAICNNMDGPRDYHPKLNKSEKEYIIYSLYVKSKKKLMQMNL